MDTNTLNRVTKIMHQAGEVKPVYRWLCAAVLLWATVASSVAQAAAITGLYDGTARVKDRSDAARTAAYSTALGVVLTKVSGRSDAPARVGAAVEGAQRYVQRYSYVAGGLLEVGFDSTAVNQLLDQAGLPLWDRDRPTTLVVYPQALQGMREAYTATEHTARLRGVPILWANGVTSEQFPANGLQKLQELAHQYDSVAVLVARADPAAATVASLRWQLVFNGATQEMTGSAEDGANLAAEALSRYYASSSKESVSLLMEVAGVDNLNAYARATSYLSGLLMIRGVSVVSLQGELLNLRLEVRGNQESLRRALALDQRLIEVTAPALDATAAPSAGAAGALKYRYRP
jgi:uncharacterized protein